MYKIHESYIEKIYAGWLAKIIGIRLGASIEGWTYQKIKNTFGNLEHYPSEYKNFAADDDSNGPLFFLRALEGKNESMTAQDVGEALLNYAPFEHGFFWWGGYGISTEHTAYLNLRNGITAPQSGSIQQNGHAVAEQIGGQIFIDTWGLVTPGNPDLAAILAERAASVTHDGNGIYGGIFIAVCISYSFIETDIEKIIAKALSYIPKDSEYARVVRQVTEYFHKNPDDWHQCFRYIYDNYGYDKYPGNCHIIPNSAVMILSLLYGKGDFTDTINICNMCGWDTDCNVGNVATIMGVRNGLDDVDFAKWRKPINDLLICSSVVGSLNIMDIPYGASYIAKLAYELANQPIPDHLIDMLGDNISSCHFEYPGSTHAMRVRLDAYDDRMQREADYQVFNSTETAATGKHSLKTLIKSVQAGETVYIYKKTYYTPDDFNDSRYDPCFSPIAYPGQTLTGSVFIPEYSQSSLVCLYARNKRTNQIITGESVLIEKSKWYNLSLTIPRIEGALIDEVGFAITASGSKRQINDIVAFIDDLNISGEPDYSIDFRQEELEFWTPLHTEISQFTKLKGIMYLENANLHLSCSDYAEAYTGSHDWKNYSVTAILEPCTGTNHYLNFRVQGAIRSYAVGLMNDGQVALLKNSNGYQILQSANYSWQIGQSIKIEVKLNDNQIAVCIDGSDILSFSDLDNPYLKGSIGLSVHQGSHCKYREISVSR